MGMLVLLSFIIMEGLYVICLTIDSICGTGQMESIQEIMELVGGSDSSMTEVCDAASGAKDAALVCSYSSIALVIAQIIIFGYWMKYSTLAMVPTYSFNLP